MGGRLLRISMATVVAVSMLMSGCLFGGVGSITSLELEASEQVLAFGETVVLSALGQTENGKVVSVVPRWEVIQGAGTLGRSEFRASDWDYEGPVVLRATYSGVSAEITITVNGLLGDYPDPFPEVNSPWFVLPAVTESRIVTVGGPVDFFSDQVYLRMNDGSLTRGWGRFVWDGAVMLPDDPSPATWANPLFYEELPEIPRLSHRVHFELLQTQVLGRGTNFEKSISNRTGTTFEESKELAQRLTSETRAEARWGWGQVETTLTLEITTRTQQSFKIEQEKTVTETWSFINPNDYDTYLYSSWNKVDTFYLSDSLGVPLEKSEIFAGYGFHSYPVEVRGGTVVQRTWGF